jgi:hypothetical protein
MRMRLDAPLYTRRRPAGVRAEAAPHAASVKRLRSVDALIMERLRSVHALSKHAHYAALCSVEGAMADKPRAAPRAVAVTDAGRGCGAAAELSVDARRRQRGRVSASGAANSGAKTGDACRRDCSWTQVWDCRDASRRGACPDQTSRRGTRGI